MGVGQQLTKKMRFSEAYLGPCQTSVAEIVSENHKNILLSQVLERVLNATPLFSLNSFCVLCIELEILNMVKNNI